MINPDNSLSSRILLGCRQDGDRTRLTDSFFSTPYKLLHHGSAHAHQHLEMIQMCASPGVMDGDSLEVKIRCADETELKLFTQSYNKIHPMPLQLGGRQQVHIRLGRNCLFQYVPHPTIPFRQSIFQVVNQIDMAEDAHLIWSDIISGGRIHSGERFELTRYQALTKIFRGKRLLLYDNQLLEPAAQPIEDLLFLEGYTHQATFVVVSPYAAALKKELDLLLTDQTDDLTYGFTDCAPGGLMIRALAYSGEVLHHWFTNLADMSWDFICHHRQNQRAAATKAATPPEPGLTGAMPPPKKPARKSRPKKKFAVKSQLEPALLEEA